MRIRGLDGFNGVALFVYEKSQIGLPRWSGQIALHLPG